MMTMKWPGIVALLAPLFIAGCMSPRVLDARNPVVNEHARKVELDLAALDVDGLRGPPGGKVSVSYEFCIPDTAECMAEVKAIDQTVQFMPGSPGRIGAGKNECLCIGYTRRDYRVVLNRLAELPYIRRIIPCDFE